MKSRIDHPDLPTHMISAVASLRGRDGSGKIVVRISLQQQQQRR